MSIRSLEKNNYQIVTTVAVSNFLEVLHKKDKVFHDEIYKTFNKIRKDPSRGKPLSNNHKNYLSERVRGFRIIYRVVGSEIRIHDIGNRDDVYSI